MTCIPVDIIQSKNFFQCKSTSRRHVSLIFMAINCLIKDFTLFYLYSTLGELNLYNFKIQTNFYYFIKLLIVTTQGKDKRIGLYKSNSIYYLTLRSIVENECTVIAF